MYQSSLKNKIVLSLIITFIIFILSFGLLISIGYFKPRYIILPDNSDANIYNPEYAIQFDSNNIKFETIKKYNDVKNILKKNYYQDIDENILLEGSIAGMTDSLNDPYTVYYNKEQMALFNQKTEGSYVGIGISIMVAKDGFIKIAETFEGSPAKNAGIIRGDRIIKIDDNDVSSLKDEELLIKMIKGKENTKVTLTIYRTSDGKTFTSELTRKKIKIPNIKSQLLEDKIGYIRIMVFDSEIASYFEQHLNELLLKGIKGLVIDLRDNPGGDYSQVVKIADRLLPKGLIVYTTDKYGKKTEEKSDDIELKLPITLIVNGNSASASEVLAGAIKDHNKGVLVGTKTFGKGLVQSVLSLPDGSGLKVTVARYYTPSGICIHGTGIIPDNIVEPLEVYKDVPISEIPQSEDLQLKMAKEITKKR